MSFETLLQGIQDAGATGKECLAELYVNENYCLMYTPGDTVLALYTFLDDETVLAVTFQVASKEVGDALENMPPEHVWQLERQRSNSTFVTMMQDE